MGSGHEMIRAVEQESHLYPQHVKWSDG